MLSVSFDEDSITERTVREWFHRFKTVILLSKTGIMAEKWKFSKIHNWGHYSMNSNLKVRKTFHGQ